MRDDIYRLVPLPPPFKQVVRWCQSDADWRIEGPRKAEEAVRKILADEVRPKLAREIGQILEGQQETIHPISELKRLRAQVAQTGAERLCLDHAILLSQNGGTSIDEALKAVVQERCISHEQALERDLQVRYPREREELTRRFHISFNRVNLSPVITSFVNGHMKLSTQRKRPRLNADDDISDLNG